MATFSNYLYTIRQQLSRAVGDCIMGTADSGDDTSLVDTMLRKPTDYYNELKYRCYIYAGTNEGEEREVSDSDGAGDLTLDPAFTANIDSTSKYELHRKFTAQEYLDAINLAIESAARIPYLIDLKDNTTIRLTSTTDNNDNTNYTYEYSLPTNMLYIHRIITEAGVGGKKITGSVSGTFTDQEQCTSTGGASGIFSYQSTGSDYALLREVDGSFTTEDTITGGTSSETISSISAIADEVVGYDHWYIADVIDPRDWSIVRMGSATPKLRLDKSQYTIYEDLYLQVEGQGIQDVVDDDDDVIYLPPDWLIYKAITYLPTAKIESNQLQDTVNYARAMAQREPRSYPYPDSRRVTY